MKPEENNEKPQMGKPRTWKLSITKDYEPFKYEARLIHDLPGISEVGDRLGF
jgi:hypothetical protein